MDYVVHGILQARILEWVAFLFSRGSSPPRSPTLQVDSLPASHQGSPGGSDSKVSAYNAGDTDSVPGLGRSPGEGNGNPLQYSCLENPMNGGAW